MNLTTLDFLNKIGTKTPHALYTYLERPEFTHITKIRLADRTIVYQNVDEIDILRLRLLTHRRSMSFKEKAQLSNLIRKLSKTNSRKISDELYEHPELI